MATVRVFEELHIWQQARAQCQQLFELIETRRLDNDTPLRDQMNRSSGSAMDNIAEGFDRFSKADFRNFLVIARGSNAEFRSQCYRCKDRGYMTTEQAEQFIREARHLGIKINSMIQYLDRSDYKTKPKGRSGIVEEDVSDYQYSEAFDYDLPQTFFNCPDTWDLTFQHSNIPTFQPLHVRHPF